MSRGKVWRRRVAYVLGLLVALVFLLQGYIKMTPDGFWSGAFERWGYPVWFRYLIGIIEISGGLLLLLPRFATKGALLLIPVMLGAAVTRIRDGQFGDVMSIVVYLSLLSWFAWEWRPRRMPIAGMAGSDAD